MIRILRAVLISSVVLKFLCTGHPAPRFGEMSDKQPWKPWASHSSINNNRRMNWFLPNRHEDYINAVDLEHKTPNIGVRIPNFEESAAPSKTTNMREVPPHFPANRQFPDMVQQPGDFNIDETRRDKDTSHAIITEERPINRIPIENAMRASDTFPTSDTAKHTSNEVSGENKDVMIPSSNIPIWNRRQDSFSSPNTNPWEKQHSRQKRQFGYGYMPYGIGMGGYGGYGGSGYAQQQQSAGYSGYGGGGYGMMG